MVLGSFQCWGVLLLLHIVGQGVAVLATGAGWVGYIFFFHLSSISNVLSFGRRLTRTDCYTPMVVVRYCRGRPRLVLVNHLEGLSLPRNSTTIN